MQEPIEYPIRINRYLAKTGLATRRDADRLIKEGAVLMNGKRAILGDQVHEKDRVELMAQRKHPHADHVYIAYYKPRGIITHSPRKGEKSIRDISGLPETFPVGRLDKDSEGLIILTNDGRITERLLHPRFVHEKEYEVTVRENIKPAIQKILERGVVSAGEKLSAKQATISSSRTFKIILTEGKKHQIRRMLAAVGLTVEDLKRTRIMNIKLGALTAGKSRIISGKERNVFLENLGLDTS